MAELAGLHHVALSVEDLDRSTAWYCEVLGLHEEFRMQSDDRRMAILRLPGTTQQVGLIEHQGASLGFEPRKVGLDHVAFAVGSGAELAAWAERLEERAVTGSGIIETPFGGMLNFSDPDGIALALFWNR